MKENRYILGRPLATGCAALAFAALMALVPAAQAQTETAPPEPAAAPQVPAPAANGGWRKFGERRTTPAAAPAYTPSDSDQPPERVQRDVPGQLTIQTGTYLTVRINDWLSSDHSQQGQIFTATLFKPVVVDGIVVARRGQTVTGRVVEAQKAGRVQGTSKLGVQLTDISLADGTQMQVQTSLLAQTAGTSQGRDAAGIATTTGVGAAIGAAAGGGAGAGIGAGAGALAGVIGVLTTRGRATQIYPESVLTFRMEAPVTVLTDRAPQAFRYVQQADYGSESAPRMQRRVAAPAPPPYWYNPYPYYPYYGGVSIWMGPRWGHRHGGFRRW
ncbi:MAG: hypothetical protein HY820_31610 [Acidobacteria bacterium]|nr:hypothetical protein [Acidobacteriota bacterium]